MSIKAIVFDYGGVIAFFQDADAMNEMANIAGIDASLMSRIYWDNRSIYDQGIVDGIDFFKNILADVGVFPDSDLLEHLITRDVESWSHINPETEELIRDLKSSGFKIGVLSNIIKEFLKRKKETLPVFNLIDTAVFSCDVGCVKPEPKIYRILLSQLECKAEECIFFDDFELNVKAARSLGIQALLWKNPCEARKELEILCAGHFGGPV